MTTYQTDVLEIVLVDPNQTGTKETVDESITSLANSLGNEFAADLSTVGGSPYTLPYNAGEGADKSGLQVALYTFTGTIGAFTVYHPAVRHHFKVRNNASSNVLLKTLGGTGITITPSSIHDLYCDGTNVIDLDSAGGGDPVFVGDSGSGGVPGDVPAPGAGDAAKGKYLGAGGNWSVPVAIVVPLVDGPTVAVDASLGKIFKFTTVNDPTILAPSNPTDGQELIIRVKASGADRTVSLTTGAGGFRFGAITALTPTINGTTDYIGSIYNADDTRWDVVAYDKGH